MEARQVTNHGDLLRISQAVAASREGGGGAGGLLKSTTCTAVNKIYLVEALKHFSLLLSLLGLFYLLPPRQYLSLFLLVGLFYVCVCLFLFVDLFEVFLLHGLARNSLGSPTPSMLFAVPGTRPLPPNEFCLRRIRR